MVLQRQHYSFMEDKCKPEMLEYTKSKSCRRRQILDFFKVTSQGRIIEKKNISAVISVLKIVLVDKTVQKMWELWSPK